jgi:hypothetical protein
MARKFLAEVYRRDPVLAIAGWVQVGLCVLFLLIAPFDSRAVTGLNPWIKPMKFCLSVGAYLWTAAWFLGYLPRGRAVTMLRWGVSTVMLAEIGLIAMQAARGVPSHYNVSTPFNAAVFQAMGVLILVNTLLAAVLLAQFVFRRPGLSASYLWGIRVGIFLFILGGLEGFAMIANQAHTVGLPDGGPGLPLLNWSTAAGDLRIAHLLGLHSLQILPLAGYWFDRWKLQPSFLFLFATLYTIAMLMVFRQAVAGEPLIRL